MGQPRLEAKGIGRRAARYFQSRNCQRRGRRGNRPARSGATCSGARVALGAPRSDCRQSAAARGGCETQVGALTPRLCSVAGNCARPARVRPRQPNRDIALIQRPSATARDRCILLPSRPSGWRDTQFRFKEERMLQRISFGAMTLTAVLMLSIAGAAAHDETKYPDWSGQWRRAPATGINWDESKPRLKQEAPLIPEYQAIWEASVADQAAHGQSGGKRVRRTR